MNAPESVPPELRRPTDRPQNEGRTLVRMASRRLHRVALWTWKYLPLRARRWLVRVLYNHGPIGAVAVITNAQGHVLFVHPTYRRDRNWSLPGGFTSYSERPIDTVRREVCEELGIEIDILMLLAEGTGDYGDVAFAYAAIIRDPAAPITLSEELDGYRYFARDALPPMASPIGRLLGHALKRLDAREGTTQAP
jgi:ADP-ribose pyrophosphatase YjhB (NUDIX family)